VSESIDCVSGDGWFHIRLQPVAVYYIDTAVEQSGDVILQAGILENGDPGRRIEFDHDVGVALGTLIAPRPRTKQGGMSYAPLAEARLRSPAA
jgi:hypothetical protein